MASSMLAAEWHAASMDIDGTPSHASPTVKSKAAARIDTRASIIVALLFMFVRSFFNEFLHSTTKERLAFVGLPPFMTVSKIQCISPLDSYILPHAMDAIY